MTSSTTTTERRGMTVADLFRLNSVSDAQISPDGARVAFVVTRMDEEADEYRSAIWLVDYDGGEPRRFTHGPKRDTAPRWSPDGRTIAFLSEREGKKAQVYLMPADGGEARGLTDVKPGCEAPLWSPDGSRIAFVARVEPPEPAEAEKEKSKPARIISQIHYRSNDSGFIYDRRKHIFIVPVDGGDARQITDGDWDDGAPAWSPDSRQVAFSAARHAERDYDHISDIWAVSAEGGEPRAVTPGRGPAGYPSWSPDGQQIAYLGHQHALDMGRNDHVWIIPATGGEPRCLTESLDRTCLPLGSAPLPWIADGGEIAFRAEDHGDVPAFRVTTDGSSPPVRVLGGERQIAGVTLSQDGARLAFTATDAANPAELFAANAGGSGERPLTDCNADLKREVSFGTPERFQFEREGFTIDGWLMKPAGFQAGTRYPTLLHIHGGPATQYGATFFDEFQVAAGHGYAVLYLNPRGSQGYGEAFTRAVRADWGGGDYADVMAGLEEALRRYDFLDPERLGVLGGSYGGYMTTWIVGHSDRFKAACSERALNTFVSMFGTSDIGSTFPETQAGCLPWEEPQWFIDHSPITYAQNITTPLLIMHAENDLRCPIEQAEQLFVLLKKLRREVLFVRFPDETHEMSRSGRPRHRRERFQIILDWFDKYLKAGA